jgi:hypothetical protein
MLVGNRIKSGRPRIELDEKLLIRLRHERSLGWLRMAQEYRRETGKWVSKETVRRRYGDAVKRLLGL